MLEKKALNEEELDQVTGGDYYYKHVYYYKVTVDYGGDIGVVTCVVGELGKDDSSTYGCDIALKWFKEDMAAKGYTVSNVEKVDLYQSVEC